ncbi:hypothetical protein T492DRAFT_928529 [Pavlovales sp. CCMP2436]|nr:hypothetical protein T492DRAFT_928529 [Pavlovales sp. CCMP2436]
MPAEMDEVTPPLAPALSLGLLSPLHLPARGLRPGGARLPDGFNLDGPLSPTGKAAASALFVLSSGKARAPLNLAPAKRPLADEEDDRLSKRIRSSRCGTCFNCLRPDCGACVNCSDKPKFGGNGVKKQACSGRKCVCPNRALNFQDGDLEEED